MNASNSLDELRVGTRENTVGEGAGACLGSAADHVGACDHGVRQVELAAMNKLELGSFDR